MTVATELSDVIGLADILLSLRDPSSTLWRNPYESCWATFSLSRNPSFQAQTEAPLAALSTWLATEVKSEGFATDRAIISIAFAGVILSEHKRMTTTLKEEIASYIEHQLQNPETAWKNDISVTGFVLICTHRLGISSPLLEGGLNWLNTQRFTSPERWFGDIVRASIAVWTLFEFGETNSAREDLLWIVGKLRDSSIPRSDRLFGTWIAWENISQLPEVRKQELHQSILTEVLPRASLILDRRAETSPIELSLIIRIMSIITEKLGSHELTLLTAEQRNQLRDRTLDNKLLGLFSMTLVPLLLFAIFASRDLLFSLGLFESPVITTLAGAAIIFPGSVGAYKLRGYSSDPVLKKYLSTAFQLWLASVALASFVTYFPILLQKP